MSADNFIAVFSSFDSLGRPLRWYVAEGMMSNIMISINEEDWKKGVIANTIDEKSFPTREAALVAAHDMAKKIDILEYGVIELS
jgi:hypothetical protein